MRFTRDELETFRGKHLPDLVGPDVRLLFVGVNPGLRAVAVQAPFDRRGNRFYGALYRAGIVDRLIDASEGLAAEDRQHLIARGVGITSLVPGATARADELSAEQLMAGVGPLTDRVRALRPALVAILGITAYRVAFRAPNAVVGPQDESLAGAQLWVVPNPSGLNAHATVDTLAAAYRAAAGAAGIELLTPPPRG